MIPEKPEKATPAQRRALCRLPLPAETVKYDTYRRALWWRIVQWGWARWDGMGMLYRTDAGARAAGMEVSP